MIIKQIAKTPKTIKTARKLKKIGSLLIALKLAFLIKSKMIPIPTKEIIQTKKKILINKRISLRLWSFLNTFMEKCIEHT